ncbi:hypothetical protein ACIQU8_35505 [Streptomyces griseus]
MTVEVTSRDAATTRPFGAVVELPEPVGFALDTEKLKEYAD